MADKNEKLITRLWWLPFLIGIITFVILVSEGFFVALIAAVVVFFIVVFIIGNIDDKNEKRTKEQEVLIQIRKREEQESLWRLKSFEYDVRKKIRDLEDTTRNQRQKCASDLKIKAKMTVEKCNTNKSSVEKFILLPTYESISLQKKKWNTLNGISMQIIKIEKTVDEIKYKEVK